MNEFKVVCVELYFFKTLSELREEKLKLHYIN